MTIMRSKRCCRRQYRVGQLCVGAHAAQRLLSREDAHVVQHQRLCNPFKPLALGKGPGYFLVNCCTQLAQLLCVHAEAPAELEAA